MVRDTPIFQVLRTPEPAVNAHRPRLAAYATGTMQRVSGGAVLRLWLEFLPSFWHFEHPIGIDAHQAHRNELREALDLGYG